MEIVDVFQETVDKIDFSKSDPFNIQSCLIKVLKDICAVRHQSLINQAEDQINSKKIQIEQLKNEIRKTKHQEAKFGNQFTIQNVELKKKVYLLQQKVSQKRLHQEKKQRLFKTTLASYNSSLQPITMTFNTIKQFISEMQKDLVRIQHDILILNRVGIQNCRKMQKLLMDSIYSDFENTSYYRHVNNENIKQRYQDQISTHSQRAKLLHSTMLNVSQKLGFTFDGRDDFSVLIHKRIERNKRHYITKAKRQICKVLPNYEFTDLYHSYTSCIRSEVVKKEQEFRCKIEKSKDKEVKYLQKLHDSIQIENLLEKSIERKLAQRQLIKISNDNNTGESLGKLSQIIDSIQRIQKRT